ncbi:MAG: MarR family transcriptional regulator [Lewinellaceae bacterium]|nr:MarR family transcriptional regulator [Lewinellaceae bacterium]
MTTPSSPLPFARQDKKAAIPGFILERTAKRLKQYFQQQLLLLDAGITIDQWVMLQSVEHTPGINQLDLAKAVFKDAPTVTRMIDLLVNKGLLERRPDPGDRRRFCIHLTPAGQAKIQEVLPHMRQFRQEAWAGLTEGETETLMSLLNKVFQHLEPTE